MRFEMIASRDNMRVKQAVLLSKKRQERQEQQCFVVEGVKLIQDAVQAGYRLKTVFVLSELVKKYSIQLDFWEASGTEIFEISQPVSEKLTDTSAPQGIYAVVKMLDKETQAVRIEKDAQYILLSSMQDPGNIGVILRTAAAMGIDGVVLSADCPDLYNPKVLRSSMGGVFRAHVSVVSDLKACIARFQDAGVPVFAAALSENARPVSGVDFSRGSAVIIGNEGNGLTKEIISQCDGSVIIPMKEDCESLNAGIAAAILMWEMTGRTRT